MGSQYFRKYKKKNNQVNREDLEQNFCVDCKRHVKEELVEDQCPNCYEPQTPKELLKGSEEEKGFKMGGFFNPPNSPYVASKPPSLEDPTNLLKLDSKNVEKWLSKLEHNIKIDIPDAPYPLDPNHFRNMFDKWMKLLSYSTACKHVITDRGGGKSKNVGLYLLYRVATEDGNNPFLATFVMRNYDENTKIIRPQYTGYIDDFVDWYYKGSPKDKATFRLIWTALYRAVQKDDRERISFVDLYNPSISKKTDKPHREIIFEETVPTKEQIRKNGGWISHGGEMLEESNYNIVYKSAGRGITEPRMTFLGNPNMPWIEIWFLTLHWEKELEEISKWYWSHTPKNLRDWRKWTWSFVREKWVDGIGKIFLYLEKTVHEHKLYKSEEDFCWHNFFKTKEDMRIVDFVYGSEPLYLFNGCILYFRKITKEDPMNTGFWYFADINNPHLSNREELFDNLKEICVDPKQRMLSQLEWKVDRNVSELRKELLQKYDRGQLKFCDPKARLKILAFIGDKKISI